MKILRKFIGLVVAAAALPVAVSAQQYTISTIAGVGGNQADYGDGTLATQSGVYDPTSVGVDPSGNVYAVQLLSQIIREVTASTGIITSVIGTGTYGFQGDNGPAVQAEISDIHGIAVDSSGNVFLSDTGNSRIRRIDAKTLNITTVAGNGTIGYTGDGGLAINAELGRPAALAVDSSGNLYVPDYAYSVVRKIDTKGNISTIAGTGAFGYSGDGGAANKANFGSPEAVAVDAAGNVYIADTYSQTVRKLTTDGNINTIATNVNALDLVVDASGNLYYPDYLTNTVKKILPNGTQIAIAGNGIPGFSGDGGSATSAQLNLPSGLAIDSKNNIYIADTTNQVVRKLTPVSSPLNVVNAASGLNGAYAPGEIVTIYGSGLGPATLISNAPANGVYSTSLAGTSVTFDGRPAPIVYTSATQVAAVVPYRQAAGVTSTVNLTYQGSTLTTTYPTTAAAPGIFTANGTGSGQAAAINQDLTSNGPAHPAKPNTYVSIYMTGEGFTNPGGQDGVITQLPNLPVPGLNVYILVNGQRATFNYAGEAPGEIAGLMQVNVLIPQIPASILANGPVSVPISVQVGGFPTQTGVTLTVSN